MIWSEQELARLAICKEDVIIDRMIKHLAEPENQEIFASKYVSYLWGILGVIGTNGLSQNAAVKIWAWLDQNGILDAFDKGILDDFNKHLIHQCDDERMRGWINLDNFTAGLKFEKTILRPLAKLDDGIKNDIDVSFPNTDALINRIHRFGIDVRLQNYLANIKPIANDENLFSLDVIFDKEQCLLKLAKTIAYTNYSFSEPEKNFLWYYFLDAVNKGFQAERIGLSDKVLSRLVASPLGEDKSELDKELLQARNDSIYDFLQELANKDCFFEETAAKMILFNPEQIPQIMDKCLALAQNSQHPNGVVFALALINLQQIKSAVIVLQALAKFGVVSEACGFMHRLLPHAKGGESVVLDLLKNNLQEFKKRSHLVDDEAYQEFLTRSYLQAVRAFLEVECFDEAADLLCFTVREAWIKNVPPLIDEFKRIGNLLLEKNKLFMEQLRPAATLIGLSIYEEGDVTFIGIATDNPLTQTRHRLEAAIKDTTTFDVSSVLGKMSSVENDAYNALQNLKQTFKKKKQGDTEDMPQDIQISADEPIQDIIELTTDTVPAVNDEIIPQTTDETSSQENILDTHSLDSQQENASVSLDNTSENQNEITNATMADDVVTANDIIEDSATVATTDAKSSILDIPAPILPSQLDVKQWEQIVDSQPTDNKVITQGLQSIKDKLNFNNILNISAQEIDKHFEKIKQSADNALNQAKEQITRVKQKVDVDIEDVKTTSVDKMRGLATKFNFIKHKKN